MIKTNIDLSKLDLTNKSLEGYIWDSNEKYPEILRTKGEDFSKWKKDDTKSYIVEALLFCEKENLSWHIRHNGQYHITEFDLDKCKEEGELQGVAFLSHRLNPDGKKTIEKLCFKQFWKKEKDEYCNDWDVLKMQALIFTGFDK